MLNIKVKQIFIKTQRISLLLEIQIVYKIAKQKRLHATMQGAGKGKESNTTCLNVN